jgi:predicted PurR-regulated permease PerM
MQSTSGKQYPFFIKAPLILIGLYLFFYILFLLKDILVPFAFAALIAILLNPLCNRLQQFRIPRIVAITLSLLIAALVLAVVFYFLSSQISQFGEMLPTLKERSQELMAQFQQWVAEKLGVSMQKQTDMIHKMTDSGQQYVGQTLGSIFGIMGIFLLLPVYTFLLLLYKKQLVTFIYESFGREHKEHVQDVLLSTKTAIQSYIVGLLIEMCIVAVLNSTGLLILGVKYAILLGTIGAILNVIPYLGGLIAIALPVMIATVTNDNFTTPLLIVGVYLFIQFIDNNFIVPKVVASKVSINVLISIVIVLMGGAIWGLSGMFLAIPFVAILKIIFDHIEGLKPWGRLLGDDNPASLIKPGEKK